jgi:hypothetical protein
MPLWRTISSTWLVMLMKSIRAGTLNVRYSVCDFMVNRPNSRARPRDNAVGLERPSSGDRKRPHDLLSDHDINRDADGDVV